MTHQEAHCPLSIKHQVSQWWYIGVLRVLQNQLLQWQLAIHCPIVDKDNTRDGSRLQVERPLLYYRRTKPSIQPSTDTVRSAQVTSSASSAQLTFGVKRGGQPSCCPTTPKGVPPFAKDKVLVRFKQATRHPSALNPPYWRRQPSQTEPDRPT